MLRVLFYGNVKLFFFWIYSSFKLLNELPLELSDSNALAKRMANGQEFVVNVNKSFITKYNNDMTQLGIELKSLHSGRPLSFKMRLIGFFIVRMLVILTAFSSYPMMSFVVSLLQFIVLPYSVFVSIGYGIETAIALFSGHILIFPLLKYFVDLLCPMYLNVYISFSPLFLIIFLIVDEIICALCLIRTPKGITKKMSVNRVWQSVWFGFLNCKTYYLVLIPLLFGQSLPLTVWIIDAVLGVSDLITKRIMGYWELMFYHIHRMGHVQNVYPDAHKFHHYLHDTTAFDAHIFGSGAPEEWLLLIIEFLIAVFICGGVPPSLSYSVLAVSWYGKWGLHSRAIKPEHHSDNFHADHHVKHIINFGMETPLDMVMQTTSNREHAFNGYKIKRVESGNVVSLQFTPLAQSSH